MQQLLESLRASLLESGMDALGAGGDHNQRVEAAPVEGVDGVASRLRAASETLGYLGRGLSTRARQQYLASAQDESVLGAKPGFQGLALLFRNQTYEDWRFHEDHYSSSHTICSGHALENLRWLAEGNPQYAGTDEEGRRNTTVARLMADDFLLSYIDDREVTELFNRIRKTLP
jgi:hypothetical protein